MGYKKNERKGSKRRRKKKGLALSVELCHSVSTN